MSAWKVITKSLHAKGGGPLPRKSFDEDFESNVASSRALDRAKNEGMVVMKRRAYFPEWVLTQRGRDWCEGRILVGKQAPPEPQEPEGATEQTARIARLVADSQEAAEACRRLTGAQREVLMLAAKGFTRMEICGLLNIGPDAVESRITRMLVNIGCSKTIEAAVIAAKAGIV